MYRYTIQYADPSGPFPLAHDAAWQLFTRTESAADALASVDDARGTRYAVRILDGDDVILTDVPGATTPVETLGDIYEVLRGMIGQGMAVESIQWVLTHQFPQEVAR